MKRTFSSLPADLAGGQVEGGDRHTGQVGLDVPPAGVELGRPEADADPVRLTAGVEGEPGPPLRGGRRVHHVPALGRPDPFGQLLRLRAHLLKAQHIGSDAAGDGASEGSGTSGETDTTKSSESPTTTKTPESSGSSGSTDSSGAAGAPESTSASVLSSPCSSSPSRLTLRPTAPTARAPHRAARPVTRTNPPSRTLRHRRLRQCRTAGDRGLVRRRPAPRQCGGGRRQGRPHGHRGGAARLARRWRARGRGQPLRRPHRRQPGPSPTPLRSTADGTRSTPTTRPSSVPTPTTSCPVRRSRSRANRAKEFTSRLETVCPFWIS
ncbi:hypothetical protein SCYAM73S_01945 [Streptomyces cyaneofuscatus]